MRTLASSSTTSSRAFETMFWFAGISTMPRVSREAVLAVSQTDFQPLLAIMHDLFCGYVGDRWMLSVLCVCVTSMQSNRNQTKT
jgi:hypothetical protein